MAPPPSAGLQMPPEFDQIIHWAQQYGVPAVDAIGTQIARAFGNPMALHSTADVWDQQIKPLVAESKTNLANHLQQVMDNWSGDAADDYKTYITNLGTAFGSIETALPQVAGALRSVATAQYVEYGAFIVFTVATVALIVVLIAALIPSGGISAAGIIGALLAWVGACAALLVAMINYFAQVSSAMGAIGDQAQPLDGFDTNGRLPTMSSSDANPANWKPKAG